MALVQALLAFVFRSAGKLLNTVFGWATVMLFGKVPENRQIYLSVIAFGSVAWLAALLGIAFPSVGTFLLAFVPLPEWVDRGWVRLAMLAAAVVIPIIVGVVSILLLEPEQRPKGAGATVKAVLKGYPYTLGVALTLIVMTVFAPILKLADLVKRWTTQHVPIIIRPQDYRSIVDSVQDALRRGGMPTERRQASWLLRLPTKILTKLAGGAVERLVADELTVLRGPNVEVMLHPSDMVIRGPAAVAAHTRAILAEHLTFTPAYLTWTKEANELEDRLGRIWREAKARHTSAAAPELFAALHAVERDLRRVDLPYEEWEVLFRSKLLVERALLQIAAGVTDHPVEPSHVPEGAVQAPPPAARRGLLPRLATAVGVATVAWFGLRSRHSRDR